MAIEELLQEVITEDLENLKDLPVGSDEYKVAVDGVTKLLDRAIEMDKVQLDCEEKSENRKFEKQMKTKQMKEERIDRIVKNSLTGLSIVSGIGLTVWGALKSWKFEETGTITSTPGRKFIGNLFFKK